MNIEDYREYCLSLGNDIEEKLPFQKFAEMPARAHRRPEGTVRVHRQSV